MWLACRVIEYCGCKKRNHLLWRLTPSRCCTTLLFVRVSGLVARSSSPCHPLNQRSCNLPPELITWRPVSDQHTAACQPGKMISHAKSEGRRTVRMTAIIMHRQRMPASLASLLLLVWNIISPANSLTTLLRHADRTHKIAMSGILTVALKWQCRALQVWHEYQSLQSSTVLHHGLTFINLSYHTSINAKQISKLSEIIH